MTSTLRLLAFFALVLLTVHAQAPKGGGGAQGDGTPPSEGGGPQDVGGMGGNTPPAGVASDTTPPADGNGPPPNKGQEQSGLSDKPQRPPPGRKPPVEQQGGRLEQRFQLSSGGFNIEANGAGDAPFYRYWADGEEENTVKIMFERMYQTTNSDDPAASTKLRRVNLVGGYTWNFSDATERNMTGSTTEVTFTMTGVPRAGGPADAPKPGIAFVNHLISNGNGTELKFDVVITGFLPEWWDSSATHLVTAYRVLNQPPAGGECNVSLGDMRVQRGSQRPVRPCPEDQPACGGGNATAVEFGNGNGIEALATADGGSGTGNVGVKVMVGRDGPEEGRHQEGGGNFLYISYAKFDTNLRHDPTTYNRATSSSSINMPTSQTIYDADGNPVYVDGVRAQQQQASASASASGGCDCQYDGRHAWESVLIGLGTFLICLAAYTVATRVARRRAHAAAAQLPSGIVAPGPQMVHAGNAAYPAAAMGHTPAFVFHEPLKDWGAAQYAAEGKV